jgi:hypothetical protein
VGEDGALAGEPRPFLGEFHRPFRRFVRFLRIHLMSLLSGIPINLLTFE